MQAKMHATSETESFRVKETDKITFTILNQYI